MLKNTLRLIFCLLFLFQITNAQNNWDVNRAKGKGDLVTVFFTSQEKGWVAGDDGYLAMTTDGGLNWSEQRLEMKDTINEIYFRNDDNGYLVAGRKMFVTRDSGRSWQAIEISGPNAFRSRTPEFLSIRFTGKKRGFLIGSLLNSAEKVVDSLVMRTDDGGETWQRVSVPSKLELFHIDFVNDENGWIVGDNGLILTTRDGGLTWRAQKSGTTNDLYNVDFRDKDEGYAVGKSGTILRTEDGGETWEKVTTNFPFTFLRVNFADDKNGWIVGYEGVVLRSSDKGRTWVKQESRTKENLYGLFMNKKYGWAVGGSGVIISYLK